MAKVAYTPKQASKATGANEAMILEAIRMDELPAYDAEGVPIILHAHLKQWAANLPLWTR